MLIGNKSDLDAGVDETTVKQFAQLHEFELQFHVSCKKNTGIAESFDELAKVLHKYPEGRPHVDVQPQGENVEMSVTRKSESKCSC